MLEGARGHTGPSVDNPKESHWTGTPQVAVTVPWWPIDVAETMTFQRVFWVPAPVEIRPWWPVRLWRRLTGTEPQPRSEAEEGLENCWVSIGDKGTFVSSDGVIWSPVHHWLAAARCGGTGAEGSGLEADGSGTGAVEPPSNRRTAPDGP
jgi:hypothetical protein